MALTFRQRHEVAQALRVLAQNDLDPIVKNRCAETLALLRAEGRDTLCTNALQVLQNQAATTANRVRALEIIFWLIQ